jgi:hypothetical protein
MRSAVMPSSRNPNVLLALNFHWYDSIASYANIQLENRIVGVDVVVHTCCRAGAIRGWYLVLSGAKADPDAIDSPTRNPTHTILEVICIILVILFWM